MNENRIAKYDIALESEETPDILEDGAMYHNTDFDIVIFLCPCGCREKIYASLARSGRERPMWTLKKEGGCFTLSPSINRTAGCKSHFFIERGHVRWA